MYLRPETSFQSRSVGLLLLASSACSPPPSEEAENVTVYEGARLILGNGRSVESGAFSSDAASGQMEDMVASGMAPGAVLVAATRNAAELAGFADMGTLEAGKSAEFVVLEANPLEDITNTRRISEVYLRGAKVDRDALSARWTEPSEE